MHVQRRQQEDSQDKQKEEEQQKVGSKPLDYWKKIKFHYQYL